MSLIKIFQIALRGGVGGGGGGGGKFPLGGGEGKFCWEKIFFQLVIV